MRMLFQPRWLVWGAAWLVGLILGGCSSSSTSDAVPPVADNPPNILFVIMDDVGIDQMKVFGYGGATAPSLPNIDAVAMAGVRFRNAWSMPECSPGRAAMFLGRYPRTSKHHSPCSL